MDIYKLNSLINIFCKIASEDVNDAKKKKELKPFADSIMKGKKHPWTACVNKMKKDKKMRSPEAFCARLKDLHSGTTEWRSEIEIKDKKASEEDAENFDFLTDQFDINTESNAFRAGREDAENVMNQFNFPLSVLDSTIQAIKTNLIAPKEAIDFMFGSYSEFKENYKQEWVKKDILNIINYLKEKYNYIVPLV